MSEIGIILAILAAITFLIACDIFVKRLAAKRSRNCLWVYLLNLMLESERANQMAHKPQPLAMDNSLTESLVRHFELSAASRHILTTLALQKGGMSELDVASAVNLQLARQCRQELPAAVVRKIVMILMGSHLTTIRQGKLEITNAGRHLHTILQSRSTGAAPASAFASP